VAHAEFFCHRIGNLAVRLYRHHGIARIETTLVQVGNELIKRLGAHAAGKAVLEQ
jgi:hypothetical protein